MVADIHRVAIVLSKSCSEATLAKIIDCLLCCDDNEMLNDYEAEIGQELFDALVKLNPTAAEQAMKGE